MKLKKKLLTLLKNNVTLFAIIVFGFILFKSYANNENQSIGKFSFIPSATIKAEKNEICAREFMAITFEGSGGTAPYVFTYKINDSSEQTITSNNLGIAEINFMEVDANSYNYKLISVKDNNSVVTQIDNQEVTIIVNAIPVVDFTFNKNNVCAGELITFTPQVSGAGGFKYEWIFQDGVTSELESPSHSVEYFGCTTQEQTFRVTLTVFDKNGCQNSQVKNVTVTPKPDLEFSDADSKNFNNCDNASPSNPEFTINVANDSQSTCVDSYSIDWGDGNSESSITFPIVHTYLDLGVYTMKIRGIGDAGCFSELSYQVINIGKPVSDFSIAGNQNNVCLTDAEIDFEITNFETNSSDTTYTVDFGDGSTSETYTQDEIQNDNIVSHIYEKVSCSEPNGAFIATLSMQNLCSTTEVVVNDIKILESSIAEFESQDIACINSDIEFINKSFIGDNIDCNKAANFQWDFGDGTIVNDNASSVSTNQTHQYTNSGNFTVTLSVSTECGTDIFTKDICIEEVNTPTFALDEDAGCVPLNVTASNTTTENTVCSGAVYEWEVTYTEDNCETSASWSFADGTDKNSENPRFLFSTAGQYTIVQKIITGCGTATNSKIIEVKKPPTVNIDLINDACDSVTINPIATIQNCTSNAASITYNWTFVGGLPASANTLNPGNIFYGTPGTYEVTLEVTNDCGVSDVATQTFEVFEKPVITNTDLTQEICSNQSTSLINLTSNIANTTYSWSADASPGITGFIENGDSNLIPSQTLINSQNTSGVVTYTVIPKNNDCIGEGDAVEFVIIVNTSPRITSQPVSSEICESGAATLLEVAFENGTGIATYQWFSNSTDSNSDGNLIVGATNNSYIPPTDNFGELFYYAVISFSSGGCNQIVSNTASVNVLEQPKINPIDAIQNYCLRDISKELEVTYSGATGIGVTYQWFSNNINENSGGNPIVGETANSYQPPTDNLGTFYYYVEIAFSFGDCSSIISNTANVIVNEIPVISSADISIYSNGTFSFDPNTVAGNTIPNNTLYTWSAPSFNPTGAIIGASATTTPQQIISQTLENTTNSPVKVTYTITPTSTTCSGNTFTLEVTVNPSINPNAVVLNNSCFETNDGSITTNISGGIPFDAGNPYIISWIGPNGFNSSDASISDLVAGLYTITIEDKEGFTVKEEFKVTQPDALAITKDVEKNISCFMGDNGTIEVTIDGGTLPYIYNWTTTNGSGIILNEKNQNTLTKGNYTLEVIDKNNCTISSSFALTESEEIKIDFISKNDILCFGDAAGSLEVDVSGGIKKEISAGVFDYVYNWSGPNGYASTSKNIDNLFAGTYTLNVIDDLGCTVNASFAVNQLDQINIDVIKTDESCYQKNDGSIDVTLTGGTAPYNWSWSNLATGLTLSNLAPDTYTISVTDANNCTVQLSIVINDAIFYIEPTAIPMTCNSANDASINLNLTGGIDPVSIVWSDGITGEAQRSNLAAGAYSVTITDSNATQCPIEETFIVSNPPLIVVAETVIDATDCDIENSGSINLEVSGGVAPLSFLWNTNETSEDLENIGEGDYSVQITDANGCIVIKQFNIFRPKPIDINLDEVLVKDCDLKATSKQIIATVTEGVLPFTYTWSSGAISGLENNIMTTSQSGEYSLKIVDARGCEVVKTFNVDVPSIGIQDFSYNSFASDNYNLFSIQDPIQFTNLSTGDYSKVTWDFGDGSGVSNEENPVYTYDEVGFFTITYTVEYEAGCTYVLARDVNITKGYILIIPNAFTPNGDGYNETIKPIHKSFSEIEMTIYNSWGTIVYYEKGLNFNGWNGLIKGLPAENGNYVMVVKGLTFYKGVVIETAPFTLIK